MRPKFGLGHELLALFNITGTGIFHIRHSFELLKQRQLNAGGRQVFTPRHLHAMHRCGLLLVLLQMSHVAWSVCL